MHICSALLSCFHLKKTKQKQSVRAASCTQSGPEKVVKQECRQLHCCIRERSLSSPPQLTCRNRCLSYTPFGVGHFFLMYLIVIHFPNSSDVCTASNPSNNLHSNKSASTLFDKASGASTVCGKVSSLNSHRSRVKAGKNQNTTQEYVSCREAIINLHNQPGF